MDLDKFGSTRPPVIIITLIIQGICQKWLTYWLA